jgi:alpha-L-rhamnosidase
VHVFDFGKRFPGAVRMTLHNMKPGTRLFLRPGQQIDKVDAANPVLHYEPPLPTRPAELRGMIDITSSGAVILPANSRAAPCWGYVCKGGAEESWEFRTTYHTVRAVELLGYEGQPTLDMLTGVEVCTDLRLTGAVETSSPAINRLHEVFTTTLRYDAHGVLVDNCCVERGGWFGDYDFIQKYFAFSFDLGEFQRKYFADIRAGEKPSGLPKVINPTPYRAANSDAHDFQASTVRIPWKHFAFYGDRHALAEHYPSMKRYVEALADKPRLQGFGEWMDPPPAGLSRKQAAEKMKLPGKMKGNRSLYTPNELAAAAVYCDAVEKTAQAAALLGHANDAARFRDLHERWKTKFISEFYDATKHDFGSQGANVLALAYGLHPDGDAPQIAATLARQVEVEHRGHLATGFSATQHIATLLSRSGHAAAAHQLFENKTYPSWLFALDADDNTIGVSWASGSGKGRPNSGRSIQYSLGSGGVWFFDSLGGIEPDFTQPAFKHFTLRPIPPPKLDHATIQHETPYGIIRSAWTRKDDGIHWSFTIPPNTTATVQPPGETPREFTSGTHERVFKITPTADRR